MGKNVVIIGGGASGIACAIRIKMLCPDLSVTILEKNDRIGKKVLKTGNGRCNIGNTDMKSAYYNHPEFIETIISDTKIDEMISFFRSIGLLIREEESSTRLYPYSNVANTVLEVFLYQIKKLNISVECNCEVFRVQKQNRFIIMTNQGNFECDIVIFATGSVAQETTNGYDLLKELGHTMTKLRPGLVPLKVKENLKSIQGIRVRCQASVITDGKRIHSETGEILFKDNGLSGVLALNLSRFAKVGSLISLNLFPDRSIEAELAEITAKKSLEDSLVGILPKMLAYEVLKRSKLRNLPEVSELLTNLCFEVIGDYGFNQAQIVLGGIAISEINNDFSSKIIKNLFIIGEVLDIDGACGGYNLTFAWISALRATKAICRF